MATKVVRIQADVNGDSVMITTYRAAARGRLLRYKTELFSRENLRVKLKEADVLNRLGMEDVPKRVDIA